MNLASNFIDVNEIALRKKLSTQAFEYIIDRRDRRFYDFSRTNPVNWEDAAGFVYKGSSTRSLADKEGLTGQSAQDQATMGSTRPTKTL